MPDNEHPQTRLGSIAENGTRSTPLKPVIWMTGVLVWATVVGLFLRIPTWAGVFLCILTGLSFLVYLCSFIILMATDREALRAERYSINSVPNEQRMQSLAPMDELEVKQNLLTSLEARQEKEIS